MKKVNIYILMATNSPDGILVSHPLCAFESKKKAELEAAHRNAVEPGEDGDCDKYHYRVEGIKLIKNEITN